MDAFGASPFNASARLAIRRKNVEVISGMNLPMLLELAVQRERSGARRGDTNCPRSRDYQHPFPLADFTNRLTLRGFDTIFRKDHPCQLYT